MPKHNPKPPKGLRPDQVELAHWEALDTRTRKALGMPENYAEFADRKGVTSQTVYRWRQIPEYQAYLQQRKQALAMAGAVTDIPVVTDRPITDARTRKALDAQPPMRPVGETSFEGFIEAGKSEAEAQYLEARAAMFELVKQGDSNATLKYMELFGRPFVEAERRKMESHFPSMTDDELIDAVLELIGRRRVAVWLKAQMAHAG